MENEDYEEAPCLRAVDSALAVADAVLRARNPGRRGAQPERQGRMGPPNLLRSIPERSWQSLRGPAR